MTPILLLDLDDTLLNNEMETFTAAYLKLLGKSLAKHVAPEKMVRQLLAATRKMVENNLPDCTLEQVFDQNFYPALDVSRAEMDAEITAFYRDTFPSLKPLTSARRDAVRLVETALKNGYKVVIATNPIFPQAAIHERLAWANLPVSEYPFALITSYERFHFAKPNPAFYAEIMAQLGNPDEQAVMVGNDLEMDILPAINAGLSAFWLTRNDKSSERPALPPNVQSGDFGDLLDWLNQNQHPQADETPSPTALLATLNATAAALHARSADLPDWAWSRRVSASEWSLTEICCHLRDVEAEVNLPRLKTIQVEDNPFLPGVVTDPWADERSYNQQNGPRALADFIAARKQSLAILASLDANGWQRQVRHAIFGPTTLTELVSFIATHDRTHIQQSFEVLRGLIPAE